MNIIDALQRAWNAGFSAGSNRPFLTGEQIGAALQHDVQRILTTSLDARSLDVTVVEDPPSTAQLEQLGIHLTSLCVDYEHTHSWNDNQYKQLLNAVRLLDRIIKDLRA